MYSEVTAAVETATLKQPSRTPRALLDYNLVDKTDLLFFIAVYFWRATTNSSTSIMSKSSVALNINKPSFKVVFIS